MSSSKEREQRAFEALIVSQLRKECDPDKVKPEDLPALTVSEKAAIDALGSDLIERLWNEEKKSSPAPIQPGPVPAGELVMNRAEDVNEKSDSELQLRKAELILRMRKLHEEQKNG